MSACPIAVAPMMSSNMINVLKGSRHLTSTVKQAVSELSVPVPWGEIRGKIWGPRHGHPVLCVHGWADNCGSFNTLIPLLPKECRYVAVDLPGHGLSSHRPPGVLYSFPYYVMDVRRVIDALQWDKFSIIGHSMGGHVAGMFSALYPEMVDALIFLDCFGFLPTDSKDLPDEMRQGIEEIIQFDKKPKEKIRVYTYENAVKRMSAGNPNLSEKSLEHILERGLVRVEGGVMFSRDFRINLKNIARHNMDQILDMQSRIKSPVLLVLAEDGFSKQYGKLVKSKSAILQGYRKINDVTVTVPGDHHVHLNSPEIVAPTVSDFLQTNVLSHLTIQAATPTSKL